MSLLNFLGGIGSSLISGAFGSFAINQQNAMNKELMKYQNEYNTQMWHMQNQYNSPVETMKRLREAGINPRAYQQLGPFANASQPQPSASMQAVSPLSAYQSSVRESLENALLYQEVRKKKQEVDESGAKTMYKQAQESLAKAQTAYYDRLEYHEMEKTQKTIFDTYFSVFKTMAFCAENGINPEDFAPDFGLGDGRFTNQKIFKLYESFEKRLGNRVDGEQFLTNLRKFESLTKEERYNVLKDFGLDTDGDSWLSLARWFLRLIENK